MHIAPSAIENEPLASGRAPRRRRPQRVATLCASILVVAAASTAGVVTTARSQVSNIARVDGLQSVLSPANPAVENFLLVGSDSREGADPTDPDFGGIGTASDVTGRRSDTIMVLRRDKVLGTASLLSIPRDLWVPIASTGQNNRINSAYSGGPGELVATVQQALGIPIQHYVEIDFQGFKAVVDAIGGVKLCFLSASRDTHTGLNVTEPGCPVLDGVQALAYARSRYFESFVDGKWVIDGTADLGRIKRQQVFVNVALKTALDRIKGNPLVAGDVLVSSTSALRLDRDLDVLDAAAVLRKAFGTGLATFSLPVYGKDISGKAVLLLADSAEALLDYFRGNVSVPPVVNP